VQDFVAWQGYICGLSYNATYERNQSMASVDRTWLSLSWTVRVWMIRG
jgi:hypothetical protein